MSDRISEELPGGLQSENSIFTEGAIQDLDPPDELIRQIRSGD